MDREALNALNDNIEIDVVNYEDAVDDVGPEFFEESEASVDAIPDINLLTRYVLEIMKTIDEEKQNMENNISTDIEEGSDYTENDIKMIREQNLSLIRIGLFNKYADTKLPMSFIDMLLEENPIIRNENTERMFNTLNKLLDIKEGRASIDEVKDMEEDVQKRYIYSRFGGKEGYMRAIQQQHIQNEKEKIANARTKSI